jgi:DNA-directed RNA polymerase subunit M/transcription elongation factor TFIIS
MADSEAAVDVEREGCPQCGARDNVLSLLTSMTRYFACRRCRYRWQVSVVEAERRKGAVPEPP